MRTTLDLDDDIVRAARELARREKKTMGRVVSELTRKGLTTPSRRAAETLHGFRPFPRRGGIVTNELIDVLRGRDPYGPAALHRRGCRAIRGAGPPAVRPSSGRRRSGSTGP